MKCPITQEQCQQLMAFLNSQSLDGSQVGSSHQAANVVATGLHSQAMVQHPLMPNFIGKVIISSCASTLDLSHSIFSSQKVNRLAFSANTWILDTGASDHFVHSVTILSTITSTIEAYVQLPNGETALVSHIGTVIISEHLILENVLVVPTFHFNLISISQLVKSLTCCFIFLGDMCFIQDLLHWKMIGLGKELQGLYFLQDTATQCSSQITTPLPSIASAVRTDLWHIRLGHPFDQKLYILNKTVPIVSCNNNEPCMVCPLAKQKKLPFPASQHVVDCAFALIHIDIWGPFSIPTVDGYRFFLTIVDDYTRCTWLYLLRFKSECQSILRNFCSMVETQFDLKVKIIRSDNAAEFVMKSFYQERGIIHQLSCVQTPQQNSVVERKHQHLF